MAPMRISIGSADEELLTSSRLWRRRAKNFGLGLVATAFMVGFVGVLMTEDSPPSSSSSSILRAQVSESSRAAARTGERVPLQTTFQSMRDRELGMSFIVSFAESSSASMASSSSAASAAASDPFAPENREGSLIVVGEGAFPSPGAGYSVLLNKFGTMHDHVLLVTESFEPQGAGPLTESDIAALYALVTRLPGVGFYNSGEAAGASQQVKPLVSRRVNFT